MNQSQALFRLAARFVRLENFRRELQALSLEAQRLSKQAIFALQRDDLRSASEALQQAETRLKKGSVLILKEKHLDAEGMWRAALEEYCEASLLAKSVQGLSLFPAPELAGEPDIVIGALSDVVGEHVRLAVKAATNGDVKRVQVLHEQSEILVAFLTSLDLTGSLRSKGDQARQHLRKLEDIRYDLAKRG